MKSKKLWSVSIYRPWQRVYRMLETESLDCREFLIKSVKASDTEYNNDYAEVKTPFIYSWLEKFNDEFWEYHWTERNEIAESELYESEDEAKKDAIEEAQRILKQAKEEDLI